MPESFHTDFAHALTGGEMDRLTGWLEPGTDPRRFSLYRNNVVGSAIEALRAAYPAVNRLVGESFFRRWRAPTGRMHRRKRGR